MAEQVAHEGSVRVVGTAHVSADSVDEVESVIEAEKPDVVAVELDEGRYRQLKGETPDDLDASDLLQGNTVFQFLAYWMLSYVQARMGEQFDITPGAEMLAAIESAEAHDIDVALVDRDIQITIQRFWARLSALEKLKLIGSLALGVTDPRSIGLAVGLSIGLFVGVLAEALAGPLIVPAALAPGLVVAVADFLLIALGIGLLIGVPLALALAASVPEEDLSEFDPSDLTDTDVVSMMMAEFRQFSPGGAEALIDERDAYIAHQLVGLRRAGKDVVAIVGAGHREGIERYLANPETLPPMASLVGQQSSRFSVYKAFGYLFTLGFLVFFALVAMAGVSNAFLFRLFAAWFIVNAMFTFALAKIAGAHWTSAGVGGAVAWLTSVNPLLAPGWFAGYVELRYINVNVSDISTLNELIADEERPIPDLARDLLSVPLFKLIVVVALTNVGSFVGSVVFATVLIPLLFAEVGGVDEIARLMLQGAQNSIDILTGGLL
ncbi:TraB/GumN family protein [Natronomonas sp. EA1]|uniref:TraB/GumN family protein n=1 Tax=Natronomonas sp. EA1 TaxID=3421655 RepID=UPI003EC0EC53